MTLPLRFVVCTFNLWADARWPERQEALTQFVNYHRPDILGVQEFRPATRDLLDTLLAKHQRVDDPFPGWHQEGNLYWNTDLFEQIDYGAEPYGQLERYRRLFWVRLRGQEGVVPATLREQTLLVATVHYTWPGHEQERRTGLNPRIEQARQTAAALRDMARVDEPVILMGDLNDSYHPLRVLQEAGLQTSYNALGRNPAATRPSLLKRHEVSPQVNDWMLHRGPLRPMTCDVVDFLADDLPPSDHKPLLVTYAWRPQ